MNLKKTGSFLRQLRKEKGITQEQFAEIINVSARTVSRWETGANMPDLSILIQIAEYYNVEIKELLDGERKSEGMEKELKETLLKVADYSELQRRKAAAAGNIAFGIMFVMCAAAIVVQMLAAGSLSMVIGETAALVLGGMVYIILLVRDGAWENGTVCKSTRKRNLARSLVCSGVFAVIFLFMMKRRFDSERAVWMAVCFFAVFTAVTYAVLQGLAFLGRKRENDLKEQSIR